VGGGRSFAGALNNVLDPLILHIIGLHRVCWKALLDNGDVEETKLQVPEERAKASADGLVVKAKVVGGTAFVIIRDTVNRLIIDYKEKVQNVPCAIFLVLPCGGIVVVQ